MRTVEWVGEETADVWKMFQKVIVLRKGRQGEKKEGLRMRKVRECVAKCITILMVLNLALWLVRGNAVVMAKCEDSYKCYGGWHTFKDYYLKTASGGIHGTRYVYVSKKFKIAGSKQQIMTGYLAWNMTGNKKIRLATTTDYEKNQIFIVPEDLDRGVHAVTYLKRGKNTQFTDDPDEFTGNYIKARIEMSESSCHTHNIFTKIATHETGHALGMSHVSCMSSIMYPGSDSKKMLAAPSELDKATLCHLYNAMYK